MVQQVTQACAGGDAHAHPDPAYRGSARIAGGAQAWAWSGTAWSPRTTGAGGAGWSLPFTGEWAWGWLPTTGWIALHRSDIAITDLRQPPLVRSRGRFLYDRSGRVVFLHGVNMVWKRPPYSPPSAVLGNPLASSYVDERDGDWLAANGFNGVRLGVLWAGVEPTRGSYDDAYLQRMRAITAMFDRHGIGVLVDSHQDMYTEAYGGEGFPDWARQDVGQDPHNIGGFPINVFAPSVRKSWNDFWNDVGGVRTAYVAALGHVASGFAGTPNLLGYEIVNEPFADSSYLSCIAPTACKNFQTGKMQTTYEQAIAAIRRFDGAPVWWEANVISVIGGTNNVGRNRPLYDPAGNTVLSFHSYCAIGGAVPHVSREQDFTCPTVRRLNFAHARTAGDRNGSAPVLTEFGAENDPLDAKANADVADANMTSWFWWQYGGWNDPTGNAAGEGINADDLNRPGTVRAALAQELIRCYPQAVAGTPIGFGFDSTGDRRRCWLHFQTDTTIAADTVIFVPKVHYPDGFRVEVAGPVQVVAAADDQHVQLHSTGPGDVQVVITRRM